MSAEIKALLRLAYEAGYSQGYADAGDEDGFPDGAAAGFSAWLPENFSPTPSAPATVPDLPT